MSIEQTTQRPTAVDADLGAQIGKLQADLTSIASTLSKLVEHRMSELGEEAQEGLSDFVREGQQVASGARAKLTEFETKAEQAVRTQPLVSIGLAAAVGFLLSELTHRR